MKVESLNLWDTVVSYC